LLPRDCQLCTVVIGIQDDTSLKQHRLARNTLNYRANLFNIFQIEQVRLQPPRTAFISLYNAHFGPHSSLPAEKSPFLGKYSFRNTGLKDKFRFILEAFDRLNPAPDSTSRYGTPALPPVTEYVN